MKPFEGTTETIMRYHKGINEGINETIMRVVSMRVSMRPLWVVSLGYLYGPL